MRKAIRKLLLAVLAWPSLAIAAEPLLFHEHGFGLSFTPDGTVLLLAPSHEGLAAFHDGEWEAAPGVARGFSGFSITERAIYSSGHSAPGPSASPNSAMGSAGLYVSSDEGRSWRRRAARGLEGEVHALAAHPGDAATVAAATGQRLYLSRDSGETFRPLGRRTPVGALTFASDGRLLSARVLSDELSETGPDGRSRGAMRLPRVPLDYLPPPAVVW